MVLLEDRSSGCSVRHGGTVQKRWCRCVNLVRISVAVAALMKVCVVTSCCHDGLVDCGFHGVTKWCAILPFPATWL